jgi:hypothetical protein
VTQPSRRAFLAGTAAAAAAAATAALSGCSALPGSDRATSTLDRLRVANRDIRAHTVSLYVEYDDHDPMVWRSYDLGPPDGDDRPSEAVVDYDWPDDPGRYTVRARVDDHRHWQSYTDVTDADCTAFELDVLEGGSLLGTTPSEAVCQPEDA